jgi:hypothetical protein
MHLIVLHDSAGSGNPLGVSGNYERIPMAPYFLFKDLITIFAFIFVLSLFVFFMPNVLGDSENYVIKRELTLVTVNVICISILYKFISGIFILSNKITTVPLTSKSLRAPLYKSNFFKPVYAPENKRHYTTFSNLSHNNSSHAHCKVSALKSASANESCSLNPFFVTGFVDGEGSFILKVSKSPRYLVG